MWKKYITDVGPGVFHHIYPFIQQGNKEDIETILKYTISYQIIFVNLRKREKKTFFCLFLSQINNSRDFKSEGKSVINSFLTIINFTFSSSFVCY
jgi:hypothetical protein